MLTWGDAVAVERLFLRHLDSLSDGLFTGCLSLESCSETSCTLLVHLRPRGHAIDGHEEELLRFDLAEEMLNVVEYTNKHLFFTQAKRHIFSCILVSTIVDDAIHVKLYSLLVRGYRRGHQVLERRGSRTREFGSLLSAERSRDSALTAIGRTWGHYRSVSVIAGLRS